MHRHLNIRRTKRRNKFQYLNSRGGHVKDVDTLKRISKLKIPPAYQDVKISCKNTHKLQAIGYDKKGRPQYIYRDSHTKTRSRIKFRELVNFGLKIEKIRKDVWQKLKDDDNVHSKDKIIALVVYLIDKCLFRIGSHFYTKKYKTYGSTTLKPEHINYQQNQLHIQFVGKKKVVNYCYLKKPEIIKLMKQLVTSAEPNNFIFRYIDNRGKYRPITAGDINRFLKKYDPKITVKMFRTWAANYIFLEETVKDYRKHKDLNIKVTDMYAKKHVIKALKAIANKLHNTPGVSKKSYMNNQILSMYLDEPQQFYNSIKSGHRRDLNKLLVNLLSNS